MELAGWPPSRSVLTGSCPCQSFSQAGKGAGFNDVRHLWPAFHHIISQLRPAVCFGEQVASKQALEWWDIVSSDLEGSGYACAAADLPAACVQAPHLRSRLFWVATRGAKRRGTANDWEFRELGHSEASGHRQPVASGGLKATPRGSSISSVVGHANGLQRQSREHGLQPVGGEFGSLANGHEIGCERGGIPRGRSAGLAHNGSDGGLANSNGARLAGRQNVRGNNGQEFSPIERASRDVDGPNQSESFWADADWLACTDGNWRAAKPGTRVLAPRISGRMVIQRPGLEPHTYSARGAIKGFGNAIVPPLAAEFIRSLM